MNECYQGVLHNFNQSQWVEWDVAIVQRSMKSSMMLLNGNVTLKEIKLEIVKLVVILNIYAFFYPIISNYIIKT